MSGTMRRKMEVIMMQRWAVKAILFTVILSIPLYSVSAANHSVGGTSGWDLTSNIQAWSASTSFHVGDTLVFRYTPLHDVLEVNQMEYSTCQAVNPISVHRSGDSLVRLTQPGTRYFICGRNGFCAKGLKFRVDVLPRLAVNETRRGGGRVRPPRPSPWSPPNRSPPPPPGTPDFHIPDVPELPPGALASPGPRHNSAVAGMIMARCLDWWVFLFSTLLCCSLPFLFCSPD